MESYAFLFCVEIYNAAYGSLAYRAESLAFVGFHAAVLKGSEHSARHVAAAFVTTDAVGVFGIGWGGNLCSSWEHILPF